jgi:hypothetical protein
MKTMCLVARLVKLKRALPILTLFIFGCASYQSQLDPIQSLIASGQPLAAAEKMKEKAFAEGDDQVVYLLEYATAMQIAQNFEESNRAFLMAEELSELKDYTSLSRITGSLLSSAQMVQYKGEDYEKVLINAMLAINFLMLNKKEASMVETRKLNDKLYRYRFEAKKPYEQNAFAFYLSALIREEEKDWDGAYIDFKKAYDLSPSVEYLKRDLVRSAHRARRSEEKAQWQKQFGISDNATLDKNQGELVVIFQQGWAPRKRTNPEWRRIPRLYESPSRTDRAVLKVSDTNIEETSQLLYSVTDVSMRVLNDQYAKMVAERVAGIAAKAVVSDQIRQKNELLGNLAWIGMNIADQADLRQWLTLPSSYQVIKKELPAGEYKISLHGESSRGQSTGETREEQTVQIRPGQKTFIQWRSVQ